ncbi:probable PEX1 - peroxisomal assembly protein -peroxin [Melanopsichium pennsylvanicum]|uniref:Peroxisomal ATPase PEX1 n=2 Tax=Melanopsichium pennsylvanicum TaxID=63383 RepID=A0AAJ4XQ51_9BASI|nr:probable PEX1-peroxisomal assembly protein-peroxin [Melanopsichium pennsylvanicum 4]SNX86268.1 probable PEX1 - peroxisomal assembly protein -peroxin [Melanopsichium pennsylvanicum]
MSRSSKSKTRSAKSTVVRIQHDPTLKSSLVHLPMCLYAPLVDLAVPPQSLVVEIDPTPTIPSAIPYYAGWSGMSAAPLSVSSSLTPNGSSKASVSDVLNISPSLAAVFHPPLQDGATCSVRLLRSPPLPTASKIDVTPLSADDWEILSLHAEEVEMNMLGQVRAATINQVLIVHVGRGGNTVVRFCVDGTTPATASVDAAEPDTEDAAIAVRLSTDTEVIIAPRLRKKATDPSAQEEHSLQSSPKSLPDGVGGAGELQSLRQTLPKLLWRVLPQRFAQGLDLNSLQNGVAVPEIASMGYTELQRVYTDGRLSITKVSCPTNNTASEMSQQGRDRSSTKVSGAGSEDADQSGANGANGAMPKRPTASARFVNANVLPGNRVQSGDTTWPERHILVGAGLREQLGIQDYDLVRFGAPPPGFLKSLPPKNTAQESDSFLTDSATSNQETGSELAGVNHILDQAEEAIISCFRSRTLSAIFSAQAKPYSGSSAMLLTGGPGSGKTVVSKHLAETLSANYSLLLSTSYHDCSPYSEERVPVLRARFSEWLNEAAWKAPSLLILDNIDRIIPAELEHVDSQRSRQLAEAFVSRVRDTIKSFGVFIVATAQGGTSLNGLLNSSHLWLDEVKLKPPGKEGRREVLEFLVRKKVNRSKNGKDGAAQNKEVGSLNFVTLATQTEGYLPADLKDLVERATHQAAIRAANSSPSAIAFEPAVNGISENGILEDAPTGTVDTSSDLGEEFLSISMSDFSLAQEGFTPLSLRDVKLEKSTVAWSDIGGLVETRRVLRETLEWPTKYAAIFASCPLRLRSGLLLYGYPGCGKTLLASAVAKECGLNFISVKGPEILNKYIGASEKSVRDLFDRAQAAKPCVLFFDEFDSIAPKRGHDSTGVTDRVVNQMLTQMDGAEGLDGVYVLAATSRPDLIDSALLRPGRLDKSLLCDMPGREDRVDIMRAIATKVHLSDEVDLEKWADRTAGFSGADLQALLYNAHLEAIHESITAATEEKDKDRNMDDKDGAGALKFATIGGTKKTLSGAEQQALVRKLELVLKNSQLSQSDRKTGRILPSHLTTNHTMNGDGKASKKTKGKTLVTEAHLETSIKSTRPSVPFEEQKRLSGIYRTFAGDRDGNFPDGEASKEIGARSSLM